MMQKPTITPNNPHFSSGPCAKRPGWTIDVLKDAAIGRSHRSGLGKARLKEVIDRSRALLNIPENYRIAIVPASDTGAYEMAMWSMLGARGVQAFAWESFGKDWVTDVLKQLKLDDSITDVAPFGALPDLAAADWANDVLFTWNGTTSGVCVPDADWIADDRTGLALCDATSAVFAMDVPFEKLDVITWSWQKVMGSEAAHGMLVLSPRAVERLESYTPDRPLPKIFRMTKAGKLDEALFEGATINTPSMIAVEDALDALKWMEAQGGLKAMQQRSRANLAAIEAWVKKTDWIDFLAEDEASRSCTSICLKIVDDRFISLDEPAKAAFTKKLSGMLEKEDVAYDINAYRDAPAGLRIWGGATVETSDIEALLPWLDWAYDACRQTSEQTKVA